MPRYAPFSIATFNDSCAAISILAALDSMDPFGVFFHNLFLGSGGVVFSGGSSVDIFVVSSGKFWFYCVFCNFILSVLLVHSLLLSPQKNLYPR